MYKISHFPTPLFFSQSYDNLDLEDSFSIALLGVGGITALWLAANIVGSIDRIPLFPKLMELVGLGYSIWFTTRYLLFKRNRDELASKIEEVKQQVLGSKN
ncbi:putative cyanobacterial aminoacyl-tRNA synthetase, CAAD domain, protein CURVATURE THYLAKOID 1 [Helianthus debilis subsp. tardiflorus]